MIERDISAFPAHWYFRYIKDHKHELGLAQPFGYSGSFPSSYANHPIVHREGNFAVLKMREVHPKALGVGYLLVRVSESGDHPGMFPVMFRRPGARWRSCIKELAEEGRRLQALPNPNNNCLEDWKCPRCGSFGPFAVVVEAVCDVSDDGTEDFRNVEWDGNNIAYCSGYGCSFSGEVRHFTNTGEDDATDA